MAGYRRIPRPPAASFVKYLDKYLNICAILQLFYTNRLVAGTFRRKKWLFCLRWFAEPRYFKQIWVANTEHLMQKLFNSHSLKMSLRLIVVLLLSFILVNLLA